MFADAMLTDLIRLVSRAESPSGSARWRLNRLRHGVKLAESRPLVRKSHEKRRRFPSGAELAMKRRDPIVNSGKANGVRVEHRAAPMGRKTISGQVNDVDVGRPRCDGCFKHARALVDERVDCPLEDFLVADAPAANTRGRSDRLDQIEYSRDPESAFDRRRSGTTPCRSSVRAGQSRRACPPRVVFARRAPRTGASSCRTRQATSSPPMSSTAKMPIAMPQSVSTPSTCSGVAPSSARNCASYMYGNIIRLPTNPGPLRTTTPTLPSRFANANAVARTSSRCRMAANDFEQAHHVRRAEEVQTDDRRRPVGRRRDLIDIQRGCVCRQHAAWPRQAIDLRKDLLFQRQVFEHGLDDQVGRRTAVVSDTTVNQPETLVDGPGGQPAARDRRLVIPPNGGEPSLDRFRRRCR